jgi:hypothetical protein
LPDTDISETVFSKANAAVPSPIQTLMVVAQIFNLLGFPRRSGVGRIMLPNHASLAGAE